MSIISGDRRQVILRTSVRRSGYRQRGTWVRGRNRDPCYALDGRESAGTPGADDSGWGRVVSASDRHLVICAGKSSWL